MRRTIQPAPEPSFQIEQVRHLYATKRCARALLNHAAKRISPDGATPVTVDSLHGVLRIEEQTVVSRRELTSTLRALAQAGCGRLVAGRRGKPSRFVWAVPRATLMPFGQASPNQKSSSDPAEPAEASPGPPSAERRMFAHPFRLRRNLMVSMNLPVDLAVREAERLARFILTLPLNEE